METHAIAEKDHGTGPTMTVNEETVSQPGPTDGGHSRCVAVDIKGKVLSMNK